MQNIKITKSVKVILLVQDDALFENINVPIKCFYNNITEQSILASISLMQIKSSNFFHIYVLVINLQHPSLVYMLHVGYIYINTSNTFQTQLARLRNQWKDSRWRCYEKTPIYWIAAKILVPRLRTLTNAGNITS